MGRWFVLAILLLAGCADGGSAEDELRAWLAEAERAAEALERRALVRLISPAYADSRGNEREDIENRLRVYFLRQHSVSLLTSIGEIRISDRTAAEMDVTVGMAGSNDGALGFSADAYRFELELVREDGDWRLIAARWGQLGEELR